jgi:hypothetical protein
MQDQRIEINSEAIGQGQERICYRHPLDGSRLIKIQRGDSDKQTRRELRFYRNLARRGMQDFSHIPRFHGFVDTNLGRGFVVDLIADYDGEVSKSLWWHFQRGYPVSEFEPYLDELRRYLLARRIVFSVDMGRYNVLFQKLSGEQARLVVIDGLGNHTAINWPDEIGYFARRKIARRWKRFIDRLRNYSAESMRIFEGEPKMLAPAYRRSG